MRTEEFAASLAEAQPPPDLSAPLQALWWDAHGEWAHAHALVDEMSSQRAMAVHAYLHRKEGNLANAEYWYRRAGAQWCRPDLRDEWRALVEMLIREEAAGPAQ